MNYPYRQIEILQQALASDKSRIAFLLGAGCPVSIRIQDGSERLIQDIAGLTEKICDTLKDGSSYQLLQSAFEGVKEEDKSIETEALQLADVKIEPCKACYSGVQREADRDD
ncbi:hypothetical protein HY02_06815 [Peptococcaceae bacterium SCADC1_2_3]|jgi:hypothetical protein|nr:hypothetical protein DK28_0205580 [Peptococcaceae bacterium SCADC1_2_3]KFI36211.1 hypothetical protein HY00_06275 [Peptococcaceae bacterium SCADC1_2_3]KFI37452.1 hypothetical protein HY02_06815 [Peptococcaceae bacterium SCADC1_2_3]